jgi:YD repeat-containing protein
MALSAEKLTGAASAQSRTIYDSRGNVVGRASTDSGGNATNYDSRGRAVSRESTSGNQTTIYDASGRNVGRVMTSRWRRGACHFPAFPLPGPTPCFCRSKLDPFPTVAESSTLPAYSVGWGRAQLDIFIVLLIMIAQPLIMGYVAQKYFHQIGTPRGLFIFWTVAAAILSWTIGKQLTKAVPRTDLEQFAALFIAVGLSSAIVLAILTILRKKQ